uniref:recombinase family protein n=1 Tax=Pseudomonas aeruginosa TaxID=287 RepID=UPI0021183764
MLIGYARVSKADGSQSLDLQHDALRAAGVERDNIYEALLQRLAAVRGRLSLCADQAAAAKWWLSMPMASVSA